MKTMEHLDTLLTDLRELTETNAHGEALRKIAAFMGDRQLANAFESVNQLHSAFGYLSEGLPEIRHNLSKMLFARIRSQYGDDTAKAINDCL